MQSSILDEKLRDLNGDRLVLAFFWGNLGTIGLLSSVLISTIASIAGEMSLPILAALLVLCAVVNGYILIGRDPNGLRLRGTFGKRRFVSFQNLVVLFAAIWFSPSILVALAAYLVVLEENLREPTSKKILLFVISPIFFCLYHVGKAILYITDGPHRRRGTRAPSDLQSRPI